MAQSADLPDGATGSFDSGTLTYTVAEGDTVRAGAPIARRGSSGTDAVKLHFEIRRNGKPADPMGYLQ